MHTRSPDSPARRALLTAVPGGLLLGALATPAAARGLSQDFRSAALAPGAVILLRHAETVPGLGDPPGFTLGDCSTQRNLSLEGRQQARQIGLLLKESAIPVSRVRTSQWCRCQETARLAFPEIPPEDWPALNSFFEDRSTRSAQLQQIAAAVRARRSAPPGQLELWVTHQVVITALTGVFPGSGELVVAVPVTSGEGGLEALARFQA